MSDSVPGASDGGGVGSLTGKVAKELFLKLSALSSLEGKSNVTFHQTLSLKALAMWMICLRITQKA